jgi:3D (Asp-Asp-Asp) domain-containing protein
MSAHLAVATALLTAAILSGPQTRPSERAGPQLSPGANVNLSATAYCDHGQTQSGVRTRPGIVAADPRVLPIGTVLRIEDPEPFDGIYVVMDTGRAIKGSRLDIYVPECGRAERFGRQMIRVTVLRLGWNPEQSAG